MSRTVREVFVGVGLAIICAVDKLNCAERPDGEEPQPSSIKIEKLWTQHNNDQSKEIPSFSLAIHKIEFF